MNHIKINHRWFKYQTPQQVGQWLALLLTMTTKPITETIDGWDIPLSPGQCLYTGPELRKILNLSKKDFRDYINMMTGSHITLEKMLGGDGIYITTRITAINWDSIHPNEGVNVFDERKRLIGYLNTQTGQNFSHTTKVAKSIDKLLREKNNPELIKRYVDQQIAELHDTGLDHLLQPSHLFNPVKFYTWKSKLGQI